MSEKFSNFAAQNVHGKKPYEVTWNMAQVD